MSLEKQPWRWTFDLYTHACMCMNTHIYACVHVQCMCTWRLTKELVVPYAHFVDELIETVVEILPHIHRVLEGGEWLIHPSASTVAWECKAEPSLPLVGELQRVVGTRETRLSAVWTKEPCSEKLQGTRACGIVLFIAFPAFYGNDSGWLISVQSLC